MYKKILSILLSSVMFCGGFVSADVIESFDNTHEKIGYIISSDKVFDLTDCETTTYNDFVFENELNIKTVSISRTRAKILSGNYVIEEDFTVKAETFESNVTDEELYEDENLNSYVSEGYTWNIPFVNGTESDLGTLGDENIKVGILDSGISNSDEFENVTSVDLVPDTVNDSLGVHFDVTGHGTNSAGIVAAAKNVNGIIGIAPNVSLYSIRVLDEDNQAPVSRIIAGIEWAIENDIDVLNMSFGTLNYSSALYDAVKRAYDSGMVLVASAGNSGQEDNAVTYPAKYRNFGRI